MRSKHKVTYRYKQTEECNYIDGSQEFEFPYEFPKEASSFLPLLAEKHDIIEEWIKDVKVS